VNRQAETGRAVGSRAAELALQTDQLDNLPANVVCVAEGSPNWLTMPRSDHDAV
jgi:hypothetical protein